MCRLSEFQFAVMVLIQCSVLDKRLSRLISGGAFFLRGFFRAHFSMIVFRHSLFDLHKRSVNFNLEVVSSLNERVVV
jgi:hypothetical protein